MLLSEMVLGKDYNPLQVRAPSGTPNGGQWVSVGRSTTTYSGSVGLRSRIVQMSANLGLSEEDFAAVKTITDEPLPGSRITSTGLFEDSNGVEYLAEWNSKAGSIFISPAATDSVLLHEVGHSREEFRMTNTGKFYGDAYDKVKRMKGNSKKLGEFGLRDYSAKTPQELLADTFVVWKIGSSQQKTNLASLFGVNDLGELF